MMMAMPDGTGYYAHTRPRSHTNDSPTKVHSARSLFEEQSVTGDAKAEAKTKRLLHNLAERRKERSAIGSSDYLNSEQGDYMVGRQRSYRGNSSIVGCVAPIPPSPLVNEDGKDEKKKSKRRSSGKYKTRKKKGSSAVANVVAAAPSLVSSDESLLNAKVDHLLNEYDKNMIEEYKFERAVVDDIQQGNCVSTTDDLVSQRKKKTNKKKKKAPVPKLRKKTAAKAALQIQRIIRGWLVRKRTGSRLHKKLKKLKKLAKKERKASVKLQALARMFLARKRLEVVRLCKRERELRKKLGSVLQDKETELRSIEEKKERDKAKLKEMEVLLLKQEKKQVKKEKQVSLRKKRAESFRGLKIQPQSGSSAKLSESDVLDDSQQLITYFRKENQQIRSVNQKLSVNCRNLHINNARLGQTVDNGSGYYDQLESHHSALLADNKKLEKHIARYREKMDEVSESFDLRSAHGRIESKIKTRYLTTIEKIQELVFSRYSASKYLNDDDLLNDIMEETMMLEAIGKNCLPNPDLMDKEGSEEKKKKPSVLSKPKNRSNSLRASLAASYDIESDSSDSSSNDDEFATFNASSLSTAQKKKKSSAACTMKKKLSANHGAKQCDSDSSSSASSDYSEYTVSTTSSTSTSTEPRTEVRAKTKQRGRGNAKRAIMSKSNKKRNSRVSFEC